MIPSFGTTGYSRIGNIAGTSTNSSGAKAKFDAFGNIVVTGSSGNGTNNDLVVVRLTSSGVLDTTFGTSGKFIAGGIAGFDGQDNGLHLDIDNQGSIYVCGSSEKASGNTDAILFKIE